MTKQLLEQAIQSFAKSIGATITNAILDYYKTSHNVTIGLKTNALPWGIGFNIDRDGNLTIIGDSYQNSSEWHRIQNLAQNYIKAYKVAQTARLTYPTAKLQTKVTQREIIMEINI